MAETQKRIIVIHNPHSTRASKVQAGVFERLDDAGVTYACHQTHAADTETNIADMRAVLRDGDIVMSAGGDGTAMQVANAVLREGHTDTLLAPMGYGNFRDLGRERDPLALLGPNAHTEESHPMTIEVNGRYLRDAPGYMTLGFTALAASRFGSPESRARMRNMPEFAKLAASIGQLGLDYFRMRDRKLPVFRTSLSPIVQQAVTDVLAINSRQVGRVIRSSTDYAAGETFGVHSANVSSILSNVPFGLRALAGHAPAQVVSGLSLRFEQPSTIPFQTEGEYAELQNVDSIFVYKDPARVIRFLRPAS
jgi:hypothetical protein